MTIQQWKEELARHERAIVRDHAMYGGTDDPVLHRWVTFKQLTFNTRLLMAIFEKLHGDRPVVRGD